MTREELALLGFTNQQRIASVHIRGPEIDQVGEWVPANEAKGEIDLMGGSFVLFSSSSLSGCVAQSAVSDRRRSSR